MMVEEQKLSNYQLVRGFACPTVGWISKKNIEDAMDFVPGDGDLIVASYPKTGTTWVEYILLQIRSKGERFPSFDDITYKIVPFIDMVGVEPVQAQDKPRFYKHHLAYNFVKKNDKSKTVYTYRNPEDTVVSYYHFRRDLDPNHAADFNTFFEDFVTGNIGYGNYFQHVLSFYEHRDDDNLLMVSYEKLHANRKDEILRIAKFLGEEHYQSLLEDEKLLEKVIEHTSFEYMKRTLYLSHPMEDSTTDECQTEAKPKINFFRKGIVGDGKAVLTDAQQQRLREAAEKVLKGTSIIEEWYPK